LVVSSLVRLLRSVSFVSNRTSGFGFYNYLLHKPYKQTANKQKPISLGECGEGEEVKKE